MHLASANEYLKRHPEEDAKNFLLGSIAPDCVLHREVTHRSAPHYDKTDGLTYLIGKVNLDECLSDFDIKTSYGRGYFFHLFMDNEFYRNTLGKDVEKFGRMSYGQLAKQLDYDYDVMGSFLKIRYSVVFPSIVAKYDVDILGEPALLRRDDYCNFIERIASIDLMGEYKNIK